MKLKIIVSIFPFILLFVSAYSVGGNEYGLRFKKGDTLYKISREYNVPIDILLSVNDIKDPTKVKEGTSIKIPLVHTVEDGDTLFSISEKYKVTVESIRKFNKLADNEKLQVGNKLYIPVNPNFQETKNEQHIEKSDSQSLLWPHSGKREKLNGKLSGIIISAKPGDPVVSVSTGRVIWLGPYIGYGKMVFVKSNKGFLYIYTGFDKILVKYGDDVKPETQLGILGDYSNNGDAKTIFCIYSGKKALDPDKTQRE
jgi:LysM repeat protein